MPVLLFVGLVLGVSALVAYESTRSTGSKVKDGDDVFVQADRLSTGVPVDDSNLKVFLAGFTSVVVKVSNVVVDAAKKQAHGSIIGFGPTVTFPLDAVASIERKGTRIV